MESNGSSRKGESFEWNFCGIDTSWKYPHHSPTFDIRGTNSTWTLSLTINDWNNAYSYRIKLNKYCSYNSYDNVVNIVTFANRFVKPICSEVNISSPYKSEYDILYFKVAVPISSITVTCTFYQFSYSKDISTQASVETMESQNNVQKITYDSSENPTASSLKSPLHLESLSKHFSDMLQKKIRTDVELKCGDVKIPAHKAVLMSRSEVFSSMFEHAMVESSTGSIDIQDMEPSILQEFLKYLYSGQISDDLSVEVVFELYKASDKYAVKSLQKLCRNMLVKNLTEENFIEILTLGEKHSDEQIKDAIVNFISERDEILMSDDWIEFACEFSEVASTIFQKYISNFLNKYVYKSKSSI